MSVRFSTFQKHLAGDLGSRVQAILMVGEMKSRLGDAIAAICRLYAETPISFAEYAAFRRGLASDSWRSYQPLLIALGDKVHTRLAAMLHDPVLAPRVLGVLMRSGGQNGVRSALGHAPHLIPHLLEGDPGWQRLAVDGLPEGLARRIQADEDSPGGVLAYLCDFARHLALHPDHLDLHRQLSAALRDYRAGLYPEVAAWGALAESLAQSHPELSALARERGETAYRQLLESYSERPLELPVHYLRDLALCADVRALPLLEAIVGHNSAAAQAGGGEPFPGAEELRRRLLARPLKVARSKTPGGAKGKEATANSAARKRKPAQRSR